MALLDNSRLLKSALALKSWVRTLPPLPTTTNFPFPAAAPVKSVVTVELSLAHVIPSGEDTITPPEPTAIYFPEA
ncbi:hypothetical protein D3C72_1038570 [compost metagenome]